MDNHVHFVIQTQSTQAISEFLKGHPQENLTPTQKKFLSGNQNEMFHELIKQQFKRLLISYALILNNHEKKTGHLFLRPFRRIFVEDVSDLTNLILHVHADSVKHGIFKKFADCHWSSYKPILSDMPTHLSREEVLKCFEGRDNFIHMHKNHMLDNLENPYSIE